MTTNKLVGFCMMVALVAVVFGVSPSSSYGQDTPSTNGATDPANHPTVNYYNAAKGYGIAGAHVLAEPAGGTNIAVGYQTLSVATGVGNTAIGSSALYNNTTGYYNTASGAEALLNNTVGTSNTAYGFQALKFNTTGINNIGLGSSAGVLYTTGSNNIAIGNGSAQNVSGAGSSNIHIGSLGTSSDNGVISIGCSSNCSPIIVQQTSAYIAGIAGVTLPSADEPLVCIDPPTGQLGTLNCASNGAVVQQEVIRQQEQQIQTLQKQNEEFQQRLSRLESLIAKK